MSNKTVVQELLEWLDTEDYNLSEFECYILNHRKELLEKEKQQIMEAYESGRVCRNELLPSEYYVGQYRSNDIEN